MITKLFKALLITTTSESILALDNQGLREAIKIEKSKRKRGKRLDLSREPDTGTVLYSPAKVVRCRIYQIEKEAIAAQKEQEKEARKIRAEVNKRLRAEKAEERAAKQADAQLRKEQKTQKSAPPKARPAKLNSTTPQAKKVASKVPKLLPLSVRPASTKSPQKKPSKVVILDAEEGVSLTRVTRSGRAIALPTRFKTGLP
jgi:hypothetical protein